MSFINFYNTSKAEKINVFKVLEEKISLPAYAIEKDWWVVQTLRLIFQMEIGEHLLFKGGTSLSKAWSLINRFSEDIDLSLSREFLGFPSEFVSKSQVKKLREASCGYIENDFFKNLSHVFSKGGIKDLDFDFENLDSNDQDPVSLLIYYPNVIEHPEYIKPRVKVEIGSRSLKEPYTICSMNSILSNEYKGMPFADNEIEIPCINPERTYLEKLFLLHEEFQKPVDKIRVNRMSRHLYDINQIAQSKYKEKARDKDLIKSIIDHRSKFNNLRGVDYNLHLPPNLNPLPPEESFKQWEEDYKIMQDEMIVGDSLPFDALIESIKKETNEYNALNQ